MPRIEPRSPGAVCFVLCCVVLCVCVCVCVYEEWLQALKKQRILTVNQRLIMVRYCPKHVVSQLLIIY
jgi:hypothetical protein